MTKELSLYAFADKLNEILPILIREFARRQAKELYKGKITLQQFVVLDYLHKESESKMTSLAHFMHITTAAMTGLVDRLVRDGYVHRLNYPKDRRIIRVKLTGRGEDLVKRVNSQRRKMVIGIFSRISKQDRHDYLRVLTRIQEVLIQAKPV